MTSAPTQDLGSHVHDHLLGWSGGEHDLYGGSSVAGDADVAAVELDQAVADRHAESRALLLGAEEGLEDAGELVVWNARAIVHDVDLHALPVGPHLDGHGALRAHGLQLSWIGTGRFIFSHDYTDDDFAEVVERFVRAARKMEEDGWWWEGAELTNESIRRRIMKRVVGALLGRR